MNSRSSLFRLKGLWLVCVLTGAIMSGCSGDSDVSPVEEDIAASGEPVEFGDEYWAELALGYEEFVPEPGIGAAIDASEFISKGRWGELIDWPEIAVGAANMTDGRIVTWASEVDDFFGDTAEVTTASIFNPLTGTFEDAGYSGHNMFCAGISMLPDGRIFLAGGGVSVSSVSVFEDNRFREIESMAMSRWYPTSTTLASGQVLTSLGTTVSGNSELWTDGYGWQMLDNVDLNSALQFPYYYRDWYPALNVAPDGSLFHPGPNNEMFSINLDQDTAYTAHGPREVGGKDRLYNTTVFYDIGKMLVAGGGQFDAKATALTIDLNGPAPVVEAAEPMSHERTMQNSVVLPNGEVLVIGGNSSGIQFSDEGSVLTPEIWNPETKQWREAAPHQAPRNYHSTALLMQDGRVISMGGGLCGACRSNHQNGEIFEPPYLFDASGEPATRPEITNAPAIAKAGDALTLTGSDDIVKFNMVRLVAVTHHHATDQRLVPVSFNKVTAGNYELELNANSNVLIPGYYWIFGLDQNGVPSTGHQIQVEVTTDVVETPSTTDTNINYAYYEGLWTELPDFAALTPVATGTQSDFSLNNRERNGAYGFVFTGEINVPAVGAYTFYLSSDDGSRLSINGEVVVDHDGQHVFEEEQTGVVFLTAGKHDLKLEYFENSAADGLLLSWSSGGMTKRPVTRFDLGSEVIEVPASLTPDPVPPASPAPVVVVEPVASEPVAAAPDNNEPLISYSYYEGNWNSLPSFDALQPVKTGTLENYSLAPREQDDFYAFRFNSRISVEVAGAYTFYTSSDDGSRLYVDNQLVVDNDGLHPKIEKNGVITLASGEHDVRVEYFEKNGGDKLEVRWSGPGIEKELLPDTVFVRPAVSTNPVTNIPVDKMKFERFDGLFTSLAGLNGLVPDVTGATDAFDLSVASGINLYGLRYTGRLQVDVADTYTFRLASDDGARLLINGNEVINNDGQHPVIEKTAAVTLTAGLHDIVVEYFQSGGGAALQVEWAAAGQAAAAIPASLLYSSDATAADVSQAASITDGGGYKVAPVWDYDLYYGLWTELPNFATLTPVVTSVTSALDTSVSPVTSGYAARFKGTIELSDAGDYNFYSSSDDGSRIYVNGQLVVDNDGQHPLIERQGQVTLGAGLHDIEITFFQGFGGQGFTPSWSGPGFDKTELIPGDGAEADNSAADSQAALLSPQLFFKYYEGAWSVLPDFNALQASRTGLINNFLLSGQSPVNQYGVQFAGQVKVDVAGDYTFYVRSNDGSRLTVADQLVVDNDGRHGAIEKQGSVSLQPGVHSIVLEYFQNGGSEALQVFWSGPGFARELVPDNVLFQP